MRIPIEDGILDYYPRFFSKSESDELFRVLRETLAWKQDEITIFGKVHNVPRLQAWYGDIDAKYSYSGIALNPLPWSSELFDIKRRIEVHSGEMYNSVLANLYRWGSDSNGWHADNEKALGINPTIASITLGHQRKFKIKHRLHKHMKKDLMLEHGSLLVMSGEMQHNWLHTIAKTKQEVGERINLTFREIKV